MSKDDILEYLAPWQSVSNPHWTFDQIKNHYNINLGKMLQNRSQSVDDLEVPYLKAQHVQWGEVQTSDLPTMWASPSDIQSLAIQQGDLLVCEGGEVGRAAILIDIPPPNCIIQNALHLVHPKSSGDTKYLLYLLRYATDQQWIEVLCNKATIAHFTVEKFGEMWAWFPSLHTQQKIAAFLDRETAQIDALIAVKQRLLRLLAEKRQALISHAVTQGIDAHVPMRDSGVPWVGKIPAHWELTQLKHITNKIGSGKTPRGGAEVYQAKGIPFIRSQNVQFSGLSLEEIVFISEDIESEMQNSRVMPLDILLNITGASIGRCCIVPSDMEPANVNQHVCIIRPRKDVVFYEYLNAILMSDTGQDQVFLSEVGVSREGLSFEDIGNFIIPLPTLQEQHRIMQALLLKTHKINNLISIVTKSLALLQERRSALIGAAVTGQIEIEEML